MTFRRAMKGRRVACSWSGGKDSCLALWRATRAGAIPGALVTMLDESGERSRSHGLRRGVIEAQARALGIPVRFGLASWRTYEREFTAQLRQLAAVGMRDVVFGDIDLDEHREWEERVCANVGTTAGLPLWRADRRALLDELWDAGFEARIVVVRDDLDRHLLGRTLDAALAGELVARGIDACGENGEFHTIVVDGPLFRSPIGLDHGAVVQRGGCHVLDVELRPDA